MEESKLQTVKLAPPPSALPILGKINPKDVSFIGRTNYMAALEEKKFIFGIKRVDRRRHLYIIGKSGVGKSKLLELLARQDIANGKGLCFIDPDGDIVEQLLNFVPENRVQDVCFINPVDVARPISFNPLANVDEAFRNQFTEGFIEIMSKQFGVNWGPQLDHILRFTILALLDYPGATLRGIVSMLSDASYRAKAISHIQDSMVANFWSSEFAEWSHKFDAVAVGPLISKLTQFFSDPILRGIFDQSENKIDFKALIGGKKIVLVSLGSGRLSEGNAGFLGSLLVAKIKQAGAEIGYANSEEPEDFYIYADEFQMLMTDTFISLLSEARKYGLALTLAHQYLSQLSPAAQSSILGNVGSIVIFRVGGEDAKILESELSPIFKAKDMINLGTQEFYIKLMIDGQSYDPFSAATLKVLPPTHVSQKEAIIAFSRSKYSSGI